MSNLKSHAFVAVGIASMLVRCANGQSPHFPTSAPWPPLRPLVHTTAGAFGTSSHEWVTQQPWNGQTVVGPMLISQPRHAAYHYGQNTGWAGTPLGTPTRFASYSGCPPYTAMHPLVKHHAPLTIANGVAQHGVYMANHSSHSLGVPFATSAEDIYVKRNLFGAPKIYHRGEPVRNALRFLFP